MEIRRHLILCAVIVIALGASGCGYNTLTTKHENVKAKWSNVETQLQRRGDLLNNLAESAKMAGVQEQEVAGRFDRKFLPEICRLQYHQQGERRNH